MSRPPTSLAAAVSPGSRSRSWPARPIGVGVVSIYLVLVLGALISVTPFVYMLLTSLKTYGSVIANTLWPWAPLGAEPLQWQNYQLAIIRVGWDQQWGTWLFIRYLANSLIVCGGTIAGVLTTSALAAY